MRLPIEPMAPISTETIPAGEDWGHQLKWDGVRIIAEIDHGKITLYSRRGLIKNSAYPDLLDALGAVGGNVVLDGEAIVFDPIRRRPNFQLILQRERLKQPARIRNNMERLTASYVLFDLLEREGHDLRNEPYIHRHNGLKELFPEKSDRLFVADLFDDGEALWQWVEENGWEGVVSKRLSSPYRIGKQHKDWFKKKTILQLEVSIRGLTLNEGRLASLVMEKDGVYFGRVSLGLNETLKRRLMALPQSAASPYESLPADLKGVPALWLAAPFTAVVSGLEITDYGLLRHPKIVSLTIREPGMR